MVTEPTTLSHRRTADRCNLGTKDPVLSTVTHDLRTLISAIFACTDLLNESLRDQADAIGLVKIIRQNSSHLLKLINNALDLSKIEAGKMWVERVASDPGQVVTEIVSLMQAAAAEKGLVLEASCLGAIPKYIHTDPMRLRQILLNLVDNAVKFTERGGVRVTVEMRTLNLPDDPHLCFRAIDSGIGMTSKHLQRVFTPFAQAQESTARRYGGTGLGLAISKHLAKLLGGDLAIHSRLNQGSTATLTIPVGSLDGISMTDQLPQLTLGTLSKGRSLNTDHRHEGRLQGIRVLLIADRTDGQLLISVILKGAGASVTLATAADSAYELLAAASESSRSFNAILLDTQMCGNDDCALVRRLRNTGCHVPIIALTTRPGESGRHRWLEAGCTDYVQTLTQTRSLVDTIARVVVG